MKLVEIQIFLQWRLLNDLDLIFLEKLLFIFRKLQSFIFVQGKNVISLD